MRSQLDSAQETTLQMRNECNDLRTEMSRAVPAYAAAVKVCHTSPLMWHRQESDPAQTDLRQVLMCHSSRDNMLSLLVFRSRTHKLQCT